MKHLLKVFLTSLVLFFISGIYANPIVLKDCNSNSLQEAVFKAPENSVIELQCPTFEVTKQIFVDRNLTIQASETILDGNGKHRFFVVAKQTGWVIDARIKPTAGQGGEGIHLTLENFIFKNGFSESIPNGCSKKLICEQGEKEKIEDGGAIYVGLWGHLTLKNVRFEGNRSISDGGAVYAHGGKSGTITIQNSRFVNNTATGGGGAIAVQALPELKIGKTHFENNLSQCKTDLCKTGERGVGAIRVWGSGLVVEGCIFKGNKGNLGGAIGSLQSWFQVSDSEFNGNQSGPGNIYKKKGNEVVLSDDKNSGSGTRGGGAIYADTGKREKEYSILRSSFTNNSGPFDGGALYLFLRNAEIDIKESKFIGNTVQKNRGAAIAIYGKANLVNLEFQDNKALEKGKGKVNEKSILFAPKAIQSGTKMQAL